MLGHEPLATLARCLTAGQYPPTATLRKLNFFWAKHTREERESWPLSIISSTNPFGPEHCD